MRWLAEQGYKVTGVDRDVDALQVCKALGEIIHADLELPLPNAWPLEGRQFNGVVVTNYLHRPRFRELLETIGEEGTLIYETFTQGHQQFGRPTRSEFLLQPGELLHLCAHLHIVAFEEVFLDEPSRFVQRIVATRFKKGKFYIGPDITHPQISPDISLE